MERIRFTAVTLLIGIVLIASCISGRASTVSVEATLSGTGTYSEVVKGKGIPPARFPGSGKWLVDIHVVVTWEVLVAVYKTQKSGSSAWGHVEAWFNNYGNITKFFDRDCGNGCSSEGSRAFTFTRAIDADHGGPDLSIGVVAGGGGSNGGTFSSYSYVTAKTTYKLTPLILPEAKTGVEAFLKGKEISLDDTSASLDPSVVKFLRNKQEAAEKEAEEWAYVKEQYPFGVSDPLTFNQIINDFLSPPSPEELREDLDSLFCFVGLATQVVTPEPAALAEWVAEYVLPKLDEPEPMIPLLYEQQQARRKALDGFFHWYAQWYESQYMGDE